MAKVKNKGTVVRDVDGAPIYRGDVVDEDRVPAETLLRRAHQFRRVQEANGSAPAPDRVRVTNVPPPPEKHDGGPPEFTGEYDIDEMHTGSGWYSLPHGERVRGRDAAAARLEELTGGD